MSHPLLTQVLADGLYPVFEHGEGRGYFVEEAAEVLAHIPADIADRLERALDVCQYVGYGYVCNGPRDAHDDERYPSHPFVPLVQRSDQEGGR